MSPRHPERVRPHTIGLYQAPCKGHWVLCSMARFETLATQTREVEVGLLCKLANAWLPLLQGTGAAALLLGKDVGHS